MKSILISIQPKWCELIASGKKTIEVRKTRPKIQTPFKCYIYQTKKRWIYNLFPVLKERQSKVIGEFVCDSVTCTQAYYGNSGEKHLTNLFGIDIKNTCLSLHEIFDYIIGDKKDGTGWLYHITDLKIYDKPKELDKFSIYGYKPLGGCCQNHNCKNYIYNGYYQPPECKIDGCFLKRAPQSWCYVEETE